MCIINNGKVSCYYTCVCCLADKWQNFSYSKVYPEVFTSGHTRRNSVVILVTLLTLIKGKLNIFIKHSTEYLGIKCIRIHVYLEMQHLNRSTNIQISSAFILLSRTKDFLILKLNL